MQKPNSHTAKVKLARKLLSPDELKAKVPLFQSKEWMKRREARGKKLLKTGKQNKKDA